MGSRYGKAELMRDIENGWTKLNLLLDELTKEEWSQIRDPAGWSIKDHLTHLTAWERFAIFFLQGQPAYVTLGVAPQLLVTDDIDQVNSAIQQQAGALTLEEARAESQRVHRQLVTAV